eukprot:symbB.v1.2.020228.t1/scaffold1690.1/size105730/2
MWRWCLCLGSLSLAQEISQVKVVSGECRGREEETGACEELPSCKPLCERQDCLFQPWSDWNSLRGCIGLCTRHRGILQSNNECGTPCMGPKIETSSHPGCLSPHCVFLPRDCVWSPWSDWSAPGEANLLAQSIRFRRVVESAKDNGRPCLGAWNETKPVAEPNEVDCVLEEWAQWTECTVTCGGGTRSRHRRVETHALNGIACEGPLRVTEPCGLNGCGEQEPPVVGDWTEWEGCSGEYPMQRFRARKMLEPPKGGFDMDPLILMETNICDEKPPSECILSMWTVWTPCTATCGGQSERNRDIDMEKSPQACKLDFEDLGMDDTRKYLKEIRPCGQQHCMDVVDSELSQWSEWTECSRKCELGTTERSRSIIKEGSGGLGAGLALKEVKGCMTDCGETDCKWGEWSFWSACSCSCAGGTKRRNRVVVQAPRHGGKMCDPIDKSEVAACNTQSCDVCIDGAWGAWNEWSKCTATCDAGFRVRHRDVVQRPNSCGQPAVGLEDEYELCTHLGPCSEDRDCLLAEWDEWSACSCSCYGVKERHRRITQFAKGNGKSCGAVAVQHDKYDEYGRPNYGETSYGISRKITKDSEGVAALEEISACNPLPAGLAPLHCGPLPKRDCDFAPWGEWGECSASCDGGMRERSRHIKTPNSNDGAPCEGPVEQIQGCGEIACEQRICKDILIMDCVWGAWSDWGDCSKCGGQRYRQRSVIKMPNECGKLCDPNVAKEVGDCTSHCEDEGFCGWSSWSSLGDCSATCGTAVQMRQRSLTFHEEEVPGENQAMGTGMCISAAGHYFKSYRVETATSEYECLSVLDTSAKATSKVKGVEFHKPSQSCNLLVEEKDKIEPYMFSHPIALKLNAAMEGVTPAGSEIAASDDTEDWRCWKRVDGYFFKASRTATCSSFQVDVLECPYQSCETCEPTECLFGAWSEWSDASCTQLCERHRVISRMNECGGEPCNGPLIGTMHCRKDCEDAVDCIFDEWTNWDASTCEGGRGQKMRSRNVKQAAVNGGQPCVGPTQETGPCDEPIEDIDCELSEWQDWTPCSVTCGLGYHNRQRIVATPKSGFGNPCEGALTMVDDCRMKMCPSQDCEWGQWTSWSDPNDKGMCSRKRKIYTQASGLGSPCEGPMKEVTLCLAVVDCAISAWSGWSPCDRSCGVGQSMRGRHITESPRNGGQACPEQLEELRGCNESPCGGKHCEVSEWKEWGICSNTCGRGTQIRERFVLNEANGGRGCDNLLAEARECGEIDEDVAGDDTLGGGILHDAAEEIHDTEVASGNLAGLTSSGGGSLPSAGVQGGLSVSGGGQSVGGIAGGSLPSAGVQGGLSVSGGGQSVGGVSSASYASPSSASEGTISSQMTSSNEGGMYGEHGGGMTVQGATHSQGLPMVGRRLQGGSCPGPRNCLWSFWSDWSKCTCECDGGQKTRDRRIAQMPTPGGEPCKPLHKEEIVPCNTHACSKGPCIDAVWNDWSQWEGCSKSCDGGITWRHRTLKQKANECGLPATGMAMEHAACNRGIPCEKDVDCVFGTWEDWSGCTMPCLGIKRRTRTIAVQGKEQGKYCVGPLKQTSPCPSGPDCFGGPPVDCELSVWESWETCSTTCGVGQRNRERMVLQRPENGGKMCDGDLVVTESCQNQPCHTCTPTDCMWGQWEMWGACDKCGGQRKRFRRVTVQADCGGRICERAYAEEISNCSRVCHTPTYCTWATWRNWGECTVSCGANGFRTRVRFLEAHGKPIPGVPIATSMTYRGGLPAGVDVDSGMEATGYSRDTGGLDGSGYAESAESGGMSDYASDGGMPDYSYEGHGGMSSSDSSLSSYDASGGGMTVSGTSHGMSGDWGNGEMQQKFDQLRERQKKVESHRVMELFTAFGLGSFSFLVLITMGQRLSRGIEEESHSGSREHRYAPAPVEEDQSWAVSSPLDGAFFGNREVHKQFTFSNQNFDGMNQSVLPFPWNIHTFPKASTVKRDAKPKGFVELKLRLVELLQASCQKNTIGCSKSANYSMNSYVNATGGREERASAVDWMLEVQVAYKLRTETLFLAVSLLDSFLRLNKVSQRELKLAVVCSLFVAGKFEEIDPPNVKDFVQLTYEVCSKQDILTMEATLLTSLEFSLCRPTAAHFLDRYQQKTVTCRKMMQKHGFLMQYLLELALVDSQMWRFPPSLQVAAAAVVSSRLLGPKSISRPFRDDDASAERSAMLTSCALELCRLLEEIEWSCHQAVRKKFLRPEYLSIAAMVSCT